MIVNNRRLLIVVCTLFLAINTFAQNDSIINSKWGITAEIGVAMSSTNSDYNSLLSPNFSIGVVRNFAPKEKFSSALQFKLSVFTEKFKDLPYFYLNEAQVLTTLAYNQINTYTMLYFGYSANYYLKPDKYFVNGSIGVNFIPFTMQNRKINNDNGSGRYYFPLPPMNIMINRPELALGFGIKKKFGDTEMYFIPKYIYNFTIGSKNLVPSFGSLSLEIIYKL